jgi:hypothetical protein
VIGVAIRQDITADDEWFAGEDRILEFTVYDDRAELGDDGRVYSDATLARLADPLDVSDPDLSFVWALRESPRSAAALLTCTTVAGQIEVVDAAGTGRDDLKGRLRVHVDGRDTANLSAGKLWHALAQVRGDEAQPQFEVRTFGQAILKLAAVHRGDGP